MIRKPKGELSAWWSIPINSLVKSLNVDSEKGLTQSQVKASLKTFGSNTIEKQKSNEIMLLIKESIKQPMMLLLLSISALSLIFSKYIEATAMVFVIISYIIVEFINKYRTHKIMLRLRTLAQPTTTVLRNGIKQSIPTKYLVIGDILLISKGSLIPADARLITSFDLTVNEASLTGESNPVRKNAQIRLEPNTLIQDRYNSIFAGTTVITGQAKAIVTAIGKETAVGKIEFEVGKTKKETTMLQKTMAKLVKVLVLFALLVSLLIPMIGLFKGLNFHEMILTWLALTFLMIPGQPPIIITMALALAAFNLAKNNILAKRLHGVETIGQVTAIVSDKTGTITENIMQVENFILPNGDTVVTQQLPQNIQQNISYALPGYIVDPTDKAIFQALSIRDEIQKKPTLFKDFSGDQPWRIFIYSDNHFSAIAGNPEILINASTESDEQKNKLMHIIEEQAKQGKRIIAYATAKILDRKFELKNIHLTALAIIKDPVRQGVKEAITALKQAGITTIIVTGDFVGTAQAIAKEIGFEQKVISGSQLDRLNDRELDSIVKHGGVFARVSAQDKLRIVKALQKQGYIVGVIGDGVNDALALKSAQVAVAMGQIGTDLAKEVSDLILIDDNYVHIPTAISISRTALLNFKKGLTYYLSAKTILLSVFIIPLALGIPFPFTPMQIIIIELLMDLASSTIFVTEKAEPNLMAKPLVSLQNFLSKKLIINIIINSIGLICGLSYIYIYTSYTTKNIHIAQTATFIAWLFGHIFLAFNLKQEKMPLIRQGLFSNVFAVVWLIGISVFSLIITNIPTVFAYFNTTRLSPYLWIKILGIAILSTFWIEIKKIIQLSKKSN